MAMTQAQRARIAGASILFTVTLADRGSDTLIRHVDALRQAVQQTKSEHPFHIRAMVILPNHLHAIWTLPKGDADYSTRWSLIKSRFAMTVDSGAARTSHPIHGDCGLWQRQFREHHISSDVEKRRLTQACWLDPVKHLLVRDPFDWPHSSIHRDAVPGVVFDDVRCGFGHVFTNQYRDEDTPTRASCAPR